MSVKERTRSGAEAVQTLVATVGPTAGVAIAQKTFETSYPIVPHETVAAVTREHLASVLAGEAVALALWFAYDKLDGHLGPLESRAAKRATLTILGGLAGGLAGIANAEGGLWAKAFGAIKGAPIGAASAWWVAIWAPHWAGPKRPHVLAKAKK